MASAFVDVALPVPLHKTFTYAVPPDLRDAVAPGKRVLVPFGRQSLTGVIVGMADTTTVSGIRPVLDILDSVPTYSDDLLRLTKWISEYYVASWGDVLRTAAPHGMAIESVSHVHLADPPPADSGAVVPTLGRTQQKVLDAVRNAGSMSLKVLKQRTRLKGAISVVRSLEQKGFVVLEDSLRRPKASIKRVMYIRATEEGTKAVADMEHPMLPKRTRSSFVKAFGALHPGNDWKLLSEVAEDAGVGPQTVLRHVAKGLLEQETREVLRDPFAGPVTAPPAHRLTEHQENALAEVGSSISAEEFRVFLLHGITGSGKTQVYIESLKKVKEKGKSAIVLVPEISLTPQTVRRFRSHFGDDVVVMHSQLSAGERYDAWRRVHRGDATIVIGPRSAIFAPLQNIGLIVVDEEHEGSYKQYDSNPRYHARDVAVVRARQNNAVVVLGSATPSVETYWNAASGKYRLLGLPERVDDAQLPEIRLVDMIAERRKQFEEIKAQVREKGGAFPKKLPPRSISRLLQQEIGLRLERKEGVILLHNRRGFAHVVECPECAYVEKCSNCDVTMTYHMRTHDLHCHYCGTRRPMLPTCPSCRMGQLSHTSYGTQQVQSELEGLFPDARIIRMDRDSTSRKGSFDRMLNSFECGDADILLGTQMVAKGLDFPRVTLVGVISAETQLYLPDFRAAERTFQLLTQVAGRAGRGKLKGEVVIQTVNPKHPTLLHAVDHDFASYYREEIEGRKDVRYPPIVRIALVECSGIDEKEVVRKAESIAAQMRKRTTQGAVEILGPAEPAIARMRNQYRQHILLKNDRQKDPSATILRSVLSPVLEISGRSGPSSKDVKVSVDIDPQSFL